MIEKDFDQSINGGLIVLADNSTSVIDIGNQILQLIEGDILSINILKLLQMMDADIEIRKHPLVSHIPSQRTIVFAAEDRGVEHRQPENKVFECRIAFLILLFIDIIINLAHIALDRFRRLEGNLN